MMLPRQPIPTGDDGIDYNEIRPNLFPNAADLTQKTCTACGEAKAISAFGSYQRGRFTRGGTQRRQVHPRCKDCRAGQARERRRKQARDGAKTG